VNCRLHPVFCIVPPHILKNIAQHGTAEQRVWVEKTMEVSTQFHGQRSAMGSLRDAIAGLAVSAGKQRMVYTAEQGSTLPGRLVRREGDPPLTNDPAVNEAYDGAGWTYDLFKEVYGRDSIDRRGLRIDSTVHYLKGYDNAFWNGSQMVYGDGDEDLPPNQRIFNRFTLALDVIGHEMTHGITQREAALEYADQPGALNESFSDVFGSLVKQYHLRQGAREADWLIGKGLFTSQIKAQGIRSLKAPGKAYDDPLIGKDPQPAHMRDYLQTSDDNGGIHINSGIPNHAFYVTAYELGGLAWEKAGKIWYVTLCDRLQTRSSISDCANLTYTVAGELYGSNSLEQKAVRKGWSEVGVEVVAIQETWYERMRRWLQQCCGR